MRLLAALKTQIEFRRDGGRHQKTIWRLRPWGAGGALERGAHPPSLSLALVRGEGGGTLGPLPLPSPQGKGI